LPGACSCSATTPACCAPKCWSAKAAAVQGRAGEDAFVKSAGEASVVLLYPLVGILSLGIFSMFFIKSGAPMSALFYVIIGVIAWNFYSISQRAITVGLTFDIWDECAKHLHLGTATDEDFIFGNAFWGMITSLTGFIIVSMIAYYVFGFNIFAAKLYLIFGLASVFLYAVGDGLIINSLVLRKGYEYTSLIWISTGIIMVLSGVYYPVEMLPAPVQAISFFLPPTHAITAIRGALGVQAVNPFVEICWALSISVIYLFLAVWVYKRSVKKSREKGSIIWF
jgi:ABC-2 type transport system permease protein